MDWPSERYVRLYTRDTTTWRLWSWEARALFVLMLRKADRSGIIEVGRHGVRGLAVHVDMPREVVERALIELIEADTVHTNDHAYIIANYLNAQEVPLSGAQRMREHRERRHAAMLRGQVNDTPLVTAPTSSDTSTSHNVTPRHTTSQAVTVVTKSVTPNRTEPNRTERSTTLRSPKTASEPNGVAIDLTAELVKSLKAAAGAPPETVSAVNWPAEAAVLWGSKTGEHFPEGRFGKAWKPLVSRYDWPPTKAGAELWLWNAIENEQRPGAKLRPEWFSRDGPRFIELAATPVVEDGILTPHGHMINGSQP